MNDESILKRTLLLTGKLVGVFSIWVTLISLVATLAASRVALALSGKGIEESAPASAEAAKKDEGAANPRKNSPADATGKPNG